MLAVISPQSSVVDGLHILQVAGRVLVASRTEPGRWYDVTAGTCGCKGFEYRGRCAHLAASLPGVPVEAADQPIPFALTPAALDALDHGRQRDTARCPQCRRPVLWRCREGWCSDCCTAADSSHRGA